MPNLLHTMPVKVEAFLSSRQVRSLTLEELGAFWLLLMEAWLDGASLPEDEVQAILGVDDAKYMALKASVIDRMFVRDGGRIYNPKSREIYEETSRRYNLCAEAGRRGMASRWSGHKKVATPPLPGNNQAITSKARPKDKQEWVDHCKSIGMTEEDATTAWNHYEAVGWVIGKSLKPVKNWRLCAETCKRIAKRRTNNANLGQRIAVSPEAADLFGGKENDGR